MDWLIINCQEDGRLSSSSSSSPTPIFLFRFFLIHPSILHSTCGNLHPSILHSICAFHAADHTYRTKKNQNLPPIGSNWKSNPRPLSYLSICIACAIFFAQVRKGFHIWIAGGDTFRSGRKKLLSKLNFIVFHFSGLAFFSNALVQS